MENSINFHININIFVNKNNKEEFSLTNIIEFLNKKKHVVFYKNQENILNT